MSKKTLSDEFAGQISSTLRSHSEQRTTWREALAAARGLSRVLGMIPTIHHDAGQTMSEMSDGLLCLCVGGDEVVVHEGDMEQVLAQRGLLDPHWH